MQVEHTVTEEITGVDLVQCQLKVAAGASLAQCGFATQADVPPPKGFAVQCRVTCEDPTENFKPDNGRIEAYRCARLPMCVHICCVDSLGCICFLPVRLLGRLHVYR